MTYRPKRFRSCAGLVLLAALVLVSASGLAASPRVLAIVVAVGEPAYYEPLEVETAVRELTEHLEGNYELVQCDSVGSFPAACSLLLLTEPPATNFEFLRNGLLKEIVRTRIPEQSMVLLFVLGHGLASPGGSSIFASDLQFIAANTEPGRVLETSISGSEIVRSIRKSADYSTFLLFLDTCNSGSLRSSRTPVGEQWSFVLSNRLFIMASSGASERSYGFGFTKALVGVLDSASDCLYGEDLVRRVNRAIRSETGLGQNAVVVQPFFGLCLGSGSATAMVSNQSHHIVELEFPERSVEVLPQQVLFPIGLKRQMYEVQVWIKDPERRPLEKWRHDFSREPYYPYVIGPGGSVMTAGARAPLWERLALVARSVGDEVLAGELAVKAVGSYRLGSGDDDAAKRLEARLRAFSVPGEIHAAMSYLETKRMPLEVEPLELANALMGLGYLREARVVTEEAFERNGGTNGFQQLVTAHILEGRWGTADQLLVGHKEYGVGEESVAPFLPIVEDQSPEGQVLLYEVSRAGGSFELELVEVLRAREGFEKGQS